MLAAPRVHRAFVLSRSLQTRSVFSSISQTQGSPSERNTPKPNNQEPLDVISEFLPSLSSVHWTDFLARFFQYKSKQNRFSSNSSPEINAARKIQALWAPEWSEQREKRQLIRDLRDVFEDYGNTEHSPERKQQIDDFLNSLTQLDSELTIETLKKIKRDYVFKSFEDFTLEILKDVRPSKKSQLLRPVHVPDQGRIPRRASDIDVEELIRATPASYAAALETDEDGPIFTVTRHKSLKQSAKEDTIDPELRGKARSSHLDDLFKRVTDRPAFPETRVENYSFVNEYVQKLEGSKKKGIRSLQYEFVKEALKKNRFDKKKAARDLELTLSQLSDILTSLIKHGFDLELPPGFEVEDDFAARTGATRKLLQNRIESKKRRKQDKAILKELRE